MEEKRSKFNSYNVGKQMQIMQKLQQKSSIFLDAFSVENFWITFDRKQDGAGISTIICGQHGCGRKIKKFRNKKKTTYHANFCPILSQQMKQPFESLEITATLTTYPTRLVLK